MRISADFNFANVAGFQSTAEVQEEDDIVKLNSDGAADQEGMR